MNPKLHKPHRFNRCVHGVIASAGDRCIKFYGAYCECGIQKQQKWPTQSARGEEILKYTSQKQVMKLVDEHNFGFKIPKEATVTGAQIDYEPWSIGDIKFFGHTVKVLVAKKKLRKKRSVKP